MEIGLVVMDENPADALKIVRTADRVGVHSLWSIDYYNRSSLTRAAAFAAVSETSIVGTSVTPLFGDGAQRHDSAALKPAPGAWFRLRQKVRSARCITDDAG